MHPSTARTSGVPLPTSFLPFTVGVRHEAQRIVVAPRGELDVATVQLLETEVRKLCDGGARALVLDPSGLTFVDSTGLRLLLQLDAYAADIGCSFALVDCDGPVRRLLELTRLLEHFRRTAR
jgi:anti-sigma B factor antagonist